MRSLILASLRHYRGLHLLVVAGVAIAVAVLAGALLVGASVRASLRSIALDRLGATGFVLSSTSFFREALADDIARSNRSFGTIAPMVALTGAVSHEDSGRTATRVQVFGIDDRFLRFHRRDQVAPAGREAWLSPALAAELPHATGDSLLLRIAKPTDIPLSTLQGRREDSSERIRLSAARVLDRAALGEFSLIPAQGPSLSIFVPLSRLQQDLDLSARVNVLLFHAAAPEHTQLELARFQDGLRRAVQLEDLGLTVRRNSAQNIYVLESRTGLLAPEVVTAATAQASARGGPTVGALSYLANVIRAGDREIPYSVITAVDLAAYDALAKGAPVVRETTMVAPSPVSRTPHPPIRLNEWAAADLGVVVGDRIDVEYFLWSDEAGLQTRSEPFTFVGIVAMDAGGGDSTLTPEYPGITDAADVTSWDPPFPVDMKKVRPRDEAYWDRWRAAPKAFIPLEVGQRLWPSAFGSLSSIRIAGQHQGWPSTAEIDVLAAGLTLRPARAEALAAADGTTDFGEYFIYFSFFLVVSGLLLAGLFFALGIEQRAKEIGLLSAVGFTSRDVKKALIGEAAILAVAGTLIGVAGAIGYAALIMYGLRTWWVSAVGTTALMLHVDPLVLAVGAVAALGAAILALTLSFRRIARRSTRTLLTAGLTTDSAPVNPSAMRHATPAAMTAYGCVALAIFLVVAAGSNRIPQVAAFFGAGGLLLIAGFAAFAAWLQRQGSTSVEERGLFGFGADYARWRPSRSVLSVALIAFACFVLVAVGAFRRDPAGISIERDSGTGGFALMAESAAPLMHNPNLAEGRAQLGLEGDVLAQAQVARFRLRPGDEASCLTLYRPTNPRIIAPEPSLVAENRFAFARSLAVTDEERANPWLLLNRTFPDGAIPAVADQTSLTYVFHLQVGDDFVFTPEGGEPIRLRMVAALADSVLQSEVIISEQQFVRLFPRHEGYRLWMIEAPEANIASVTTMLEDRLRDFGVDVIDTRARLAAYHEVENTYLSTFQALGALGLLVGTLGLGAVLARNVLERRRELGLLSAIGFTPAHLRTMVTSESMLLVGTGLALGTIAALVAVMPALIERGDSMPWASLLFLLAAVITTGLVASFAALRFARSISVVQAIKSE
jgi:ABC-type lipoprotein release transport system permease subunit